MNGIKHIEFWVSDLKQSLVFYKTLFSLINWEQVDENGFSDGQTKIYFIEQDVKPQKTIGPRHICFLASSSKVVEDVADFLYKNKSQIIRGPIDYTYKEKHAYTVDFKDPDGYILEVATESI